MKNTMITTTNTAPRNVLAATRKAYARLAVKNGTPASEIAKELGVSRATVYTYAADILPRKNSPKLTLKQIACLQVLKEKGLSNAEIARRSNISMFQIKKYTAHYIKRPKDRVEDMLIMRELGLTNAQIAKRINCSNNTVRVLIGNQPKEITARSHIAAGASRRIKNQILSIPAEQFAKTNPQTTAA